MATTTPKFEQLFAFLEELPAIDLPKGVKSIGHGEFDNGNWWVKFKLDMTHPLALRHVQELGHVLNYISVEKRLPTVFMPVSPPPRVNGGVEFLSWVIESQHPDFAPQDCARWLKERLPSPVNDVSEWRADGS